MKVQFKYGGQSAVVGGLTEARLALATNTLREAAFFKGTLGRPSILREPLAALYDVVTSDYKYRPRDRVAFKLWLEEQDRRFLAGLALKSVEAKVEIEALVARLGELRRARAARLAPFHKARHAFFEYLYENEYELEYLLDPVITIHPDELSFEVFSRDESSYGRLAAKYDLFSSIDAFECGTTNVDFSGRLHAQLSRMRSYRRTRLDVDPSGFTVGHAGPGDDAAHAIVREKKIELPESWLQGFLQVHSTMTLGLTRLRLAPIDLYNICRFLRRRRAHASPRALRWELAPGQPAKVVFEPWEHAMVLSPCSVYEAVGAKPQKIRTWGRDRLLVLARVLPLARSVDVYLAGHGLPTIWVVDMGEATFTLALSGWTDNDWTGGARFSLLGRRLEVSADELAACYHALREVRYGTPEQIAEKTGLGVEKTRSALSSLCQVGRGMFDLGAGAGAGGGGGVKVFRHRDLFFEPFSAKHALSMIQAAESESDPQAVAAKAIFGSGNVKIIARRPVTTGYKLSGSAKGGDGNRVRPLVSVDHEGQIVEASCTCAFFRNHKLTKGPCEHILALRLAHMARLEAEDS